ncbi:unnamed protein product [Gongylonema pulchrum]|uniref:Ovule protein n=1 Tax=Gongylonema pulchrum TaxID=637853 RepID=A0A183DGJ4_9BILA|nr:unnamed protein product [Gongylonema pulchrum]
MAKMFSASLMGQVKRENNNHETMALNLKPLPWYRRMFAHKENRSGIHPEFSLEHSQTLGSIHRYLQLSQSSTSILYCLTGG